MTDNGQPPKTSSGTLTVNVPRDLYKPVMSNLPGSINLNEKVATGTGVYTVSVRDGDLQVKSFCVYV